MAFYRNAGQSVLGLSRTRQRKHRRRVSNPRRFAPSVELLEDRRLLSATDYFVSGIIDTNVPPAPNGTFTVNDAERIRLSNGGTPEFTNSISLGFPAVGDQFRTVGAVSIPGARVAGINADYDGSQRFVGVFAGLGSVVTSSDPTTGGTGDILGSFDPMPSATQNPNGTNALRVHIYSRTDANGMALGGVDGNNPIGGAGDQINPPGPLQNNNNWAIDLTTPVAVLDLVTRPDGILVGLPGTPTTSLHGVLGPDGVNGINTVETVLDAAAIVNIVEDFKFSLTDFGTFFADLEVMLDPANPIQQTLDPNPTDDSFILSLRSSTDPSLSADGSYQTPDIADLNTIFNAILGSNFSDQLDTLGIGEDFTLLDGPLYQANGDGATAITGGYATPGQQFRRMTTTPEPGTMLVWSLVAGIGTAFGVCTRRKTGASDGKVF